MFDHFEFMGWRGAMGLLWILLLVLAVWLVIAVVRSRAAGGEGSCAREILDRRYARGEITRDEYQQHVEDLRR